MYDLEVLGRFVDATPPAGWFDIGLIRNFKFTPGSKIGNIVSGYRGAVRAKYRGEVAEKFNFAFAEMSRTAMRLATGSQVFNLLKTAGNATPNTQGPLNSPGVAGVPMIAYSPSGMTGGPSGIPTLSVATGTGSQFPVGSMIVCDIDYDPATYGFVGDAGANVFPGAVTDVDFIRKTSDYVAGVQQIVTAGGADLLVLTGPFVGGGNKVGIQGMGPTAPAPPAKVQAITGYASREGGTYIAEWSAVFKLDTADFSQLLLYYPRVAPDAFAGLGEVAIQNISSMQEYDMDASFEAMAFDDPLDGETVVRYSAYYPHPGTNPAQ